MKKMTKVAGPFFFFFLILLLSGNYSHAELYKYKDENGVWCYTDNAVDLPNDSEQVEDFIENKSTVKDLKKQLSANFPQRNAIEKATCGVVAVKSTIGYGSGFFISDDGYIITNKHVLKGDENQREGKQAQIDNIGAEIERIKKDFALEEAKLKTAKEKLERDKKFIDSQPDSSAKRHNIEQYESYINRYKEWENDFLERKKRFREEKIEIEDKISDYTYNRAIADISRHFKILIADNTELDVYLISTSRKYDLALLKLDGYKTPFLKPVNPQNILFGETVYAIGNPAMLRNSVAKGIVSGFEGNYIKTDAKIYPGNSGGPLITQDGRVSGINTFKKLTRKFEGLGFAISIETVLNEFKSELGDRVKFE